MWYLDALIEKSGPRHISSPHMWGKWKEGNPRSPAPEFNALWLTFYSRIGALEFPYSHERESSIPREKNMLLFANGVLIKKEEGGERWIYEPEFLTELISTESANGCLGDVEQQISAQQQLILSRLN
jgi:hypothetical protein